MFIIYILYTKYNAYNLFISYKVQYIYRHCIPSTYKCKEYTAVAVSLHKARLLTVSQLCMLQHLASYNTATQLMPLYQVPIADCHQGKTDENECHPHHQHDN